MHPDITKAIATLRVDDRHAAAAAARLARAGQQAALPSGRLRRWRWQTVRPPAAAAGSRPGRKLVIPDNRTG